ncbi:ATP-dependent acyl-CoA ligase [Ornithinimicrobium humiphilum]|uniref:Crotonobetaine/carnitine-CoA ligase n=1 Tax=Ornithinimicrobium humiphilum TaxID=125288 RepID=A0A543KRT7_9MICO|nr:AMP-binding protein [Ornithinimicrobium humiphilum]TQM97779.1 crotonobetaine/carnitine-CoA ligase [Ornithinimicrobium humiphilum]
MAPLTYRDHHATDPDQADWTLPRVLRTRTARHPDKIFLDAPTWGVTLTYGEVLDLAERIGSGLLARGHARGDRVVIMMPNNPDYILAWFGANLAGMAEVPINTAYRGSFLEHQVRTVEPSAAVITPEFADRFVESADECRAVRRFYVVGEDPEVAPAVVALEEAGFDAEPFSALLCTQSKVELPEADYRDLAGIFFTSGTTGLSKGVAMSHSQLYFFADQGASLVRLAEDDVYLSVGPLFHGNAQFLAAYPALIKGCRFVLHERFSASRWTTWIRDSGATVTNLVGVMSDFLWKQPPAEDDGDNQLRCVWAVPNPSRVAEEFKARFGIEELVENFGLTEVSMPILTPYGVPRPPGAVGLEVADWFEVQLVDPLTDTEVPVGEVGELVVRPKVPWTICSGYYNMPEKSFEAMRNGWFHTGDGLRKDEEGWYYFVDRLKDAIRRRGENISSYEVEQAILGHPAVAECAVVAVPADGIGAEDEVMAVVVLADGAEADAEELWAYFDTRIPAFAVPRFLKLADTLPTTPSGKLQKAPLRAAGREGALDRTATAAAR